MDVADILDDDGNVLPVKQWPTISRQMVPPMDVVKLIQCRGGNKQIAAILEKTKWTALKRKSMKLLRKIAPEFGAYVEERLGGGRADGIEQNESDVTPRLHRHHDPFHRP